MLSLPVLPIPQSAGTLAGSGRAIPSDKKLVHAPWLAAALAALASRWLAERQGYILCLVLLGDLVPSLSDGPLLGKQIDPLIRKWELCTQI